ncbi:MAG: SHD1 domain-containing protein [Verrucomicrobiota bacterium]
MKRLFKKSHKLVKGMPSAVLLSVAIHVGLFFLAGALVVFTVVKKREVEFKPPRAAERPKMKLKKPKVKIKKTSRPKPTTRIVTKINRASMPDIQLPEMSGMGEGLVGGLEGFDLMPDFSEQTMYGAVQSIGNDLVGTFYDSKRGRDGKVLSGVDTSGDSWRSHIHKFLRRGWDTSVFSRYYRAPQKLYATSLVVPETRSSIVPLAFGDADAVGALWMVHYKGQLVHKEAITFRFWGTADTFLIVRVGGEIVLASMYLSPWEDFMGAVIGTLWNSDSADSRKYHMGNNTVMVGDWITLEPGVPLDMEILIGDNGGKACFMLAVEEEGVEYERNRQGGPILPAFRTTELSHDLLDAIYKNLYDGETSLTNGPVFCDYDIPSRTATTNKEPEEVEPPMVEASATREMRTWTLADGRNVEAKMINIFAGKVVLENATGKIVKLPKDRLSAGDIEYAELAEPPDFDINFLKNFRHVDFSGSFYDIQWWDRPPEDWGHYGFQLKQTSTGEYNHELHAEMFVVGKQWRRSKYTLLDRQKTSFIPAEQERRLYEFRSKRKVVIALDEYSNTAYGEDYYGYVVTVTDARGKLIALESSHKWLPDKLANLRKLSVGNFMDDDCIRTYPDTAGKSSFY